MTDERPPNYDFMTLNELQSLADPLTSPTSPAGIRSTATTYVPDEDTMSKVEAIAGRLAEVTGERKTLEDEEKFLRQRLYTLLPMGTTRTGGHTVQIRENRRFDHGTAMSVLTPVEQEMCSVTSISAARAREVLPPERYAECQAVTGDPVVRLV